MEHLWLYAVLVFGIIALPGMDMAFVLANTLASGRSAGFAAVAGTVAGGFVHTVMNALGIGLLLKHFPSMFNLMLVVGSVYVMWMGYSLCKGATALSEVRNESKLTLAQIFMRAAMTCLLNPKAYLFMLAVFPQFIRPEAKLPIWLQAFVLFVIGAVCQMTVYGTIVLAAARARNGLQRSAASQIIIARTVGILLILTACWTLWTG